MSTANQNDQPNTLHQTELMVVCNVLAPLTPFLKSG